MKIFNGVILTEESIQKARKWFHHNSLECIEEVKNGKVWVNDRENYFEWRKQEASEYITGHHDNTISFLQRAYFIQTGESIALLP